MAGGDNSHEFQFRIVIIHNETSKLHNSGDGVLGHCFIIIDVPRSTLSACSLLYYYSPANGFPSTFMILSRDQRWTSSRKQCEEKNGMKKTPFKNPSHYHRHFIFPFVVLHLLMAIVLESRCWSDHQPLSANEERRWSIFIIFSSTCFPRRPFMKMEKSKTEILSYSSHISSDSPWLIPNSYNRFLAKIARRLFSAHPVRCAVRCLTRQCQLIIWLEEALSARVSIILF